MPYNTEDLAKLVEPARLHRSIYTDPEVFELEMERIWGKAWILIKQHINITKKRKILIFVLDKFLH